MSFYKFTLPGGGEDKSEKPGSEYTPEEQALADAIVATMQECRRIIAKATEQFDDPGQKIGLCQIVALGLFETAVEATLRQPEPGRTMLAGKYFGCMEGPDGVMVKIGALAHLAGRTRDRGDGNVELWTGGGE